MRYLLIQVISLVSLFSYSADIYSTILICSIHEEIDAKVVQGSRNNEYLISFARSILETLNRLGYVITLGSIPACICEAASFIVFRASFFNQ